VPKAISTHDLAARLWAIRYGLPILKQLSMAQCPKQSFAKRAHVCLRFGLAGQDRLWIKLPSHSTDYCGVAARGIPGVARAV
jgi:hypothetical protein